MYCMNKTTQEVNKICSQDYRVVVYKVLTPTRLERNFKEMDKFYQQVIDEHMADSRKNTPHEDDIVDVLLQLKKHYSFSIDITNDNIKAVIMV